MRDEMKQQNVYINTSLEKVSEHLSAIVIHVQHEINESMKRKQGVVNGTYNKVSGSIGINDNYEIIVGV